MRYFFLEKNYTIYKVTLSITQYIRLNGATGPLFYIVPLEFLAIPLPEANVHFELKSEPL